MEDELERGHGYLPTSIGRVTEATEVSNARLAPGPLGTTPGGHASTPFPLLHIAEDGAGEVKSLCSPSFANPKGKGPTAQTGMAEWLGV